MRFAYRSFHTATVVLVSLAIPAACMASDEHVVSIGELHRQIASAARSREANLSKTKALLSLPPVQSALRNASMDPAKVQNAIAGLSDDELARLASRADKVQADLTAGSLTNQQLTYIVIALATAVIILVLVKS